MLLVGCRIRRETSHVAGDGLAEARSVMVQNAGSSESEVFAAVRSNMSRTSLMARPHFKGEPDTAESQLRGDKLLRSKGSSWDSNTLGAVLAADVRIRLVQ